MQTESPGLKKSKLRNNKIIRTLDSIFILGGSVRKADRENIEYAEKFGSYKHPINIAKDYADAKICDFLKLVAYSGAAGLGVATFYIKHKDEINHAIETVKNFF